jgi:hypothetical protein
MVKGSGNRIQSGIQGRTNHGGKTAMLITFERKLG